MSRFTVTAGWADAPHLDARAIADLKASIPAFQLEARMNGTPALGSGKIYQVPEDDFRVTPFPIPKHFKQAYGLDVGILCTAAVFGAWDEDADVLYLHSLHYAPDQIAAIHADAILRRGKWQRGVIDPAARGRNPVDGQRLIEVYERLGLDLTPADNAVSAGIFEVNGRLVSGRLKVFSSLSEWFAEYRLYRRQENKIVKAKDHAMDATRYLCQSGRDVARCAPLPPKEERRSGGSKWSG